MRNENITCIYIQCVYFFYIKTNKQTDIQKKTAKQQQQLQRHVHQLQQRNTTVYSNTLMSMHL